jgi:hypothetical protein
MKRLAMVWVLVFLPLGVLAQTFNYADYFPLGVGDQWIYQREGSSDTYQVDVTGTRDIHGVLTSIFEFEDPDIPKEFLGIDSQGVLGLYGASIDFGSVIGEVELIPDSPYPIGDSDTQVGDIFTHTEQNIEIYDLGFLGKVYADITYTIHYINSGEIAITPALVFSDTVTLSSTLTIDVRSPLGDYTKTFTEDTIVARGTGVIRITAGGSGGDIFNLISARINGGVIPDLEGNSSFTYSFNSGQERWLPSGAPLTYALPGSSYADGMLNLLSTTNTNTFGFWTGLNELFIQGDTLYRAQCTVLTDVTDQTQVPQLRIRFTTQNFQLSGMLNVESNAGAESAPTPSGQTYALYFCPHNSGISSLVPTMSVAFDLLNFNPYDLATGSLHLQDITISRINLASLPAFTDIPASAASFTSGTDGWTFYSAPLFFSEPNTENSGSGSLRLQAVDSMTFGGWNSPTIAVESNMAYRAKFRVSSDQGTPAQVPTFRMRLTTGDFQMGAILTITSAGDGQASPTTTPKDYWVYFAPPASAVGPGMFASIDILNFDPGDSTTGTIQLEEFSIEKASLPLMP